MMNAETALVAAQSTALERDSEQRELLEMVTEYTIESDDDYDIATQTLQLVKTRSNAIEAERKGLVKPLRDTVDKLNGYFAPVLDKLSTMEKRLKRLMSDYQLKKREEQAALLAAAAKEAEKQKVTDVAPPAAAMTLMRAAQVAAPPVTKGISASDVMVWEVEDSDKVPREFCSPDSKKLNAAVKAGMKEIPGVRIYADVRITARAK